MKLRQPKSTITPPSEELPARPSPSKWCESFQVTTLTPIYGGGTEAGVPDMTMPVRVASIRGQLRFWWRLLKSHRRVNPLQGTELFNAEREIWGGMSEGNEDYASKVKLCVHGLSDFHLIPSNEFLQQQHEPAISYVLFSARDTETSLIPAGLRFNLDIECSKTCTQEQQQEIFEALRWWASFGGIGSRTRRGFGAIQVMGANSILSPVSKAEADNYGCQLVPKPKQTNEIDAWKKAVEPLWELRQKPGIGRQIGVGHPGSSHWPEPDSIREITGRPNPTAIPTPPHIPSHPARISFPRAAFGLPIIFEFRGEPTDPYKTELVSTHEGGRMASPLILKPMALLPDGFAPIALLLPTDHLGAMTIKLQRKNQAGQTVELRELPTANWWPLDPSSQQQKAQSISPIWNHRGNLAEGDGIDALTAFLTYFAPHA